MLLKNMQIVTLVNGSGCLVIQNGPNLSEKLNLMHHMCKMSKHGYELKLSIAKEFIKIWLTAKVILYCLSSVAKRRGSESGKDTDPQPYLRYLDPSAVSGSASVIL
jgi:hypothetical protein